MARSQHGFCTIHRVAYNRAYEAICPQCTLARMQPGEQLDFDVIEQKPKDRSGTLLDAFTLEPHSEPTK